MINKKTIINQSVENAAITQQLKDFSTSVTDEALITLILGKGDRKAYNILVQRYLKKIWRLAMSVLKNEAEAEDAVQDVFLSLMKSLEKFDLNGGAKFSTWIYRVSLNKCIDLKRKRKPIDTAAPSEDLACEEKSAYHKTLNNQLSSKLKNVMQSLPEGQKDALKLYYFEEKSVNEICAQLSKSEESIRSLLKRGKAGLKEKLETSRQTWI
ncbi:MAG: RNA polymerase sigma factor [Alphaproteobacteria bacterium]